MTYEEIDKKIKEMLSEKRYKHTMGVVEEATKLAKIHDEDSKKVRLAALMHDCVKEMNKEEMDKFCIQNNIDLSYLQGYESIVHSHLGAHYARIYFMIDDDEILEAIKYHTTGKSNMTKLEKIIYLADYLDPNRDTSAYQEEYDNAKRLAYEDLDKAMEYVLEGTIKHLLGKSVYGDTYEAYKYYSIK